MKRNGFMMTETIVAMAALAFLAWFSVQIISRYVGRVRTLKAELEVVNETKKQLEQQLLFPGEKVNPINLARMPSLTFKSQMREIQPGSSLKPFHTALKILTVSGRKEGNDHVSTLMGLVISPPTQEATT